jgi:hypothetical protein
MLAKWVLLPLHPLEEEEFTKFGLFLAVTSKLLLAATRGSTVLLWNLG